MVEVWWTYLVRCADGTYYVGSTQNVSERLKAHNGGRAARYTALRRPVRLVYTESYPNQRAAVRRERQLKRWGHAKRKALVEADKSLLMKLSRSRENAK